MAEAGTSAMSRVIDLTRSVSLMIAAVIMTGAAAVAEPRLTGLFGERVAGLVGDADAQALAIGRLWRVGFWSMGWTLPGTPDLERLEARLEDGGFKLGAPIFIRIYKDEFLLEVWLKKGERFEKFASYPICRYSGRLGPKLQQGDRQSPEGVYTVARSQLNPASRWHRSFNLGFPNTFDRAHGRTGSFLMVHGGCSSIGCYAMTNAAVDEIWRLVTTALDGGQPRFQVQAFPFRMTDANLAARSGHPSYGFWTQLKAASDHFDTTGLPPIVDVCGMRYVASAASPGSAGTHPVRRNCQRKEAVATN